MKAYLSRRYRISASHRLHSASFTETENVAIYGKCNNPYGHGHNYTIEVTVSGAVDAATGMVCNLVDLDDCVNREVVARFDHTHLNLQDSFSNQVPTTENLCITLYELIAGHLSGAHLERVRIEETSNNYFEYSGKGKNDSPSHR